jgi:sugar lactone lactonase YvrE
MKRKSVFYLAVFILAGCGGNPFLQMRNPHDTGSPQYGWVVTTIAGNGTAGWADGAGIAAQFKDPYGITVYAGNLYVADGHNNRIRKIDATGNVTTIAGDGNMGWADGLGTAAKFNVPTEIAVYAGNLYVADSDNYRIRKIVETSPGTFTVSTIAGSTQGYADGFGTAAQFNRPQGITVGAGGNLYVSDTDNNRIRKLSWQRVN